MKKKILLILLILTFITTGCSANYVLKYENDTFTEYLEVSGDGEDDAHPSYEEIKENGLYAYVDGSELFTLDSDSTSTDVKLTHTLDSVDLGELSVVSECFNLHTFIENDGSYYFSAYGGFTCTYLSDSTFTLETDSEVIMNNASEVDGNKYIWYLNEDDLEDGIKFQIKKESSSSITSNISSDTVIPFWLKIVIAILIVGVGGVLILLLNKAKE